MPKPPDAYAATRAFALSLERQGVDPEKICDALMVTATNAAYRLNGPDATAGALLDMIALVTREDPEERPTAH